jgi:hypothetical protein
VWTVFDVAGRIVVARIFVAFGADLRRGEDDSIYTAGGWGVKRW